MLGLQEWSFELLYSKNKYSSVENDHTGKNLNLVLKTTYKKVFPKIPEQWKVSFIVLELRKCIFELFLLKKQS